ncbi:hypothetical protein OKW30_000778 [Paraburkholderia sp. Clong3]|uniref:hypothetical protein n=1 Tax=Paraburkholderia sp. Clong3 TaxID=2991061 RepID=UPI003D2211F6
MDAIASTVGNLVVDQMQAGSVGKTDYTQQAIDAVTGQILPGGLGGVGSGFVAPETTYSSGTALFGVYGGLIDSSQTLYSGAAALFGPSSGLATSQIDPRPAVLDDNGIVPSEVRLGIGVGLGAHGYLKAAGSSAQGFSVDFISKGDSNLQVGDYRIGASLGANAVVGPASFQLGSAGIGGYSNIMQTPKAGTYAYFKNGTALTPSLGLGLEFKGNIIEFDYKWR